MNKRVYFFIVSSLFGLVAIVHLLRIINQFQVVIGTWSTPMAVSWVGLIIPGLLSYLGFTLMSKEKQG